MKHSLPALPYSPDALAPVMSRETIDYHYGKHFQTYIDNLNKMIENSPYEEMEIEEIVRTAGGAIYNNAAQAWNHDFFFSTLSPTPSAMPAALEERLVKDFGSVAGFRAELTKAAATLFGSGWAWLSEDKEGKLVISQEPNAGNPMTKGHKPLLTIDVWEHAYYIDYRNLRASYIEALLGIVDWEKVAARL